MLWCGLPGRANFTRCRASVAAEGEDQVGDARTLDRVQRQEQPEAAGEGAQPAGAADQEEGGRQDLLPPVVVGEDAVSVTPKATWRLWSL